MKRVSYHKPVQVSAVHRRKNVVSRWHAIGVVMSVGVLLSAFMYGATYFRGVNEHIQQWKMWGARQWFQSLKFHSAPIVYVEAPAQWSHASNVSEAQRLVWVLGDHMSQQQCNQMAKWIDQKAQLNLSKRVVHSVHACQWVLGPYDNVMQAFNARDRLFRFGFHGKLTLESWSI